MTNSEEKLIDGEVDDCMCLYVCICLTIAGKQVLMEMDKSTMKNSYRWWLTQEDLLSTPFFPSRRIKSSILLTSCKKKIIYSFCFYVAQLNVKNTFCPHTHNICIYWLVVLFPKERSSYISVLQYKYLYYINDKEALSGLLLVSFANNEYTVWAGQFLMHAGWQHNQAFVLKTKNEKTNSKPIQMGSSAPC